MESSRLIDILEDAGVEVRSYSGRGMYGDKCVGFTVEAPESLLGTVADVVDYTEDANERNEICRLFRDARTDSMGMGTIVYFPRMKWEGDE